ncbi:hypothetical protein EMCG_06459 [[Emmonsia] crescens]|uniref:CN hydrolase domain-containing protein n=1 Tax=[Emmonsia] crescens TaxID=73230 RepID=A0A0G2IBP3_9EURO|nr:hypothetical protein EMCG_06459 [Emmonsia crescens UAMH 3008]
MKTAASHGTQLIVYPETAITTFFQRHVVNQAEVERFFEKCDGITKNENIKVLFDPAPSLNTDVYMGYVELTSDGDSYNTCIYYSGMEGKVISKYRKIRLFGTSEPVENRKAVNQQQKKYFKPGNLSFNAFRAPDLIPGAL